MLLIQPGARCTCGGSERGRTSNPRFRRPVLYPLSYGSSFIATRRGRLTAVAFEAEREGFEPSVQENPIRRFSKPVPSATRPSLPNSMPAPCLPNNQMGGRALRCAPRPGTNCVTLFSCQATSGGGGIRTPGACARRFSKPLPSTTRPLLRAIPEAGAQYRDSGSLVKSDLGETGAPHAPAAAMRSSPPMYGRSTCGIRMLPSACWYCSKIATRVRPSGRPEPLRVWTWRGLSPALRR